MTDLLRHPDTLSALLDGQLDVAELEAVQAHVVACAECTAELDAVREARAAVRSLPAVEPPAGFFEGLLAQGLPEDEELATPARVLPLRTRKVAMGHVAAAVAAGLLLVVAFGGNQAQVVAPEVSRNVELHAATISAESLGGSNPIVGAPRVTPATLPHTGISRPYMAPNELAGYQLVDAFRAPKGVQLLYEKGPYGLSVFEQEGTLDFAALPDHGTRLTIDGSGAWRWDAGMSEGRVLVIERGALVVTLVGDESGAAVLAAAEALPGSSDVALETRLRRACGEALDMLSPAG
ncbi:MAG: Transrane transcriptional regulator (Anti-sigma factor RsiW) [Acidimicrobiales bacterium]|nr:Transrane transcriptional regulator (Anti-sigma factor RsiW) [Acidimicrobiales bacterium]